MKLIRFLGDSLKCLREFPEEAKQDAGYQLDKVQRGGQPDDFKAMPSIGKGVEEIRVMGRFRYLPSDLYGKIGRFCLCAACFPKEIASDSKTGHRDCQKTLR